MNLINVPKSVHSPEQCIVLQSMHCSAISMAHCKQKVQKQETADTLLLATPHSHVTCRMFLVIILFGAAAASRTRDYPSGAKY
jgi:hypothetical protein